MAFKPNYGRDRAERARAARARSEEKKRKRDEKTALRKAQRAEAEPPTDETNPRLDGRRCARSGAGRPIVNSAARSNPTRRRKLAPIAGCGGVCRDRHARACHGHPRLAFVRLAFVNLGFHPQRVARLARLANSLRFSLSPFGLCVLAPIRQPRR